MMRENDVDKAVDVLLSGGVIAYPTESCYGLGCLPTDKHGVERILSLKRRSWTKGLILVGSQVNQFSSYIQGVPSEFSNKAERSWPGPNTWLFPVSDLCPEWIKGEFDSVALRISAHPVVNNLCSMANSAIVSTSANRQGEPALNEYSQVVCQFATEIDYILPGEIGGDQKPSTIRDLLTDTLIRSS